MSEVVYDDFKDVFDRIVKEHSESVTQDDIAKELGVSQSQISRITRGVNIPNEELINIIKDKWGVDLTSAVEEAKVNFKQKKASNLREWKAGPKKVLATKPRIPATAAAGALSTYVEGVREWNCERLPVISRFPDYDFTIIIRGNSMSPKFESGDEIAVKKVDNIEWGSEYILDTEEGAVFKRVYDAKQNYRLVSYNSDEYPDYLVPKSSVYAVFKYVGMVRI